MESIQKLPLVAIFAAVFCNILFGSASPAIKLGYELFAITDDVFEKILFAGVRFFISGIMVFAFAWIKDRKLPLPAKGNRLNIVGVALLYTSLQYIFFYIGLSNTSGASGSIISSVSVFIAVIVAHFAYPDDKINLRKIIGSLVGFAGIIFAVLARDKMGSFSFMGEGFVIIASTCFVLGSVINKKAGQKNDSFVVTAYNLLIGGGVLILIGIFGSARFTMVTASGTLVLLYLSMVSAVGFTIWSSLVRKYPIGKVSVYNFVIPVSGAILSALVLGENILRWQYLLALLLVSAGIMTVNKK